MQKSYIVDVWLGSKYTSAVTRGVFKTILNKILTFINTFHKFNSVYNSFALLSFFLQNAKRLVLLERWFDSGQLLPKETRVNFDVTGRFRVLKLVKLGSKNRKGSNCWVPSVPFNKNAFWLAFQEGFFDWMVFFKSRFSKTVTYLWKKSYF